MTTLRGTPTDVETKDENGNFVIRIGDPDTTITGRHTYERIPQRSPFLAGVHCVAATHLGVSRFGQSGDLDSVYRWHGLDADSIVGAALDLVD